MLKVIIKMKTSQTSTKKTQSDFDSRMRLYGRSSSFSKLYLYKTENKFQHSLKRHFEMILNA